MAPELHVLRVWVAAMFLGSGQAAVLQANFAKLGGSNKLYGVQMLHSSFQTSPVSCARHCAALSSCASFNLRQESPKKYSCDLLEYYPRSLTSLKNNTGWSYYEKGCSQGYGLVAAGDGPLQGVELTAGQSAVTLALNGGRDLHTAVFTPDLHLQTLPYGASLASLSGGLYLGLDSMAKIPVGDGTGTELDFFTRGNEINVTVQPANIRAPGWPRPLQEVGAEGARALLLSHTGNDLLAFRSGEVVTLGVTFKAPDQVTLKVKDVLRVGFSETHRWRLAPPDVTSAAWLRANDGMASRDRAFLATPDYYIILNATDVIQRARLCRQ